MSKYLVAIFALSIIASAIHFVEPVQAGTCQPVKAKGKGKNIATATEMAQTDLKQKAKAIGGKVNQTNTNCVPGPTAVVCKIDAVVCPK